METALRIENRNVNETALSTHITLGVSKKTAAKGAIAKVAINRTNRTPAVVQRETHRSAATERIANQVSAFDAEMVEHLTRIWLRETADTLIQLVQENQLQ